MANLFAVPKERGKRSNGDLKSVISSQEPSEMSDEHALVSILALCDTTKTPQYLKALPETLPTEEQAVISSGSPESKIRILQHKAVKARTPILGHQGTDNTLRTLTAFQRSSSALPPGDAPNMDVTEILLLPRAPAVQAQRNMETQILITNSQRDLQSKMESCGVPAVLTELTELFNQNQVGKGVELAA